MNAWTKVIVFFPIWLVFSGIFYGIIFLLYPESFTGSKTEFENLLTTNYLFLFLNQIASLFGTFCSIWFISRFIEKGENDYLKGILKIRGIFIGILLGVLLILSGIILLSFFEPVEIEFQGFSTSILYYLIIFLIVAISEEVMTRGFVLNTLYSKINKHSAIAVSSIIFASMHLFNSSISLISLLNIFLVGVILALLYLKNMNLSVPIGLHLSWNFMQGPVFGFSVSGFVTESIFKIKSKSGSDFSFSGFGLEGSLIITVVFSLAILYSYVSIKRDKRVAMSEMK